MLIHVVQIEDTYIHFYEPIYVCKHQDEGHAAIYDRCFGKTNTFSLKSLRLMASQPMWPVSGQRGCGSRSCALFCQTFAKL